MHPASALADLADPAPTDPELERVLLGRAVRTVFQPVVRLSDREVLGYEALSRGTAGGRLERPDLLFDAARSAGRVRELDELCRERALSAALAAGMTGDLMVFVNGEPDALDVRSLRRPGGALARAQQQLRVVIEVTERALTAQPAELLAVVRRVRELGWAIALDDVGADPRSLALMPFLAPDIIKLDLRLVQEQPSLAVAEIVAAVAAESERSGALVLAEGIETEEHALLAASMGATLGQGWLFGRPAPVDVAPPQPGHPLLLPTRALPVARCHAVFDLVAGRRPVQRSSKRLLQAISLHLEQQAASLGDFAVVLGTFEQASYFTADTARRYQRLAAGAGFVGALGTGMPPEPAPGVRGADLIAGDPLRGEWDVAVLGPHFAAALVARDLLDEPGDEGVAADEDRRFDYVLTYDRGLVTAVAVSLMGRIVSEHNDS